MIPWLNTHTLTYLAWGLVNAGLFVQLGQQAQWGAQPQLVVPMVAEQTPGKLEIEVMPDYRLPALKKNFKETLTRPLFVPSRSEAPPIPPPPPPPKPTMKRGQFVLLGTVLLDQGNMAILKEVSGTRVRQIAEGSVINGIKLENVLADRVVLSQYDELEELRLKVTPSPKAAPQISPQSQPDVQQQNVQQQNIQSRSPAARGRGLPRASRSVQEGTPQ